MHQKPIHIPLFTLCLLLVTCLCFAPLTVLAQGADQSTEPITETVKCNWQLNIRDSQEILYTEYGESLKKIITLDFTATKKGGTDYYGDYTGTGTITVFNALAPGEDALTVTYGGQNAISRQIKLAFTLAKSEDPSVFAQPGAHTNFPARAYDGTSELAFTVKIDKVVGLFADALDINGLAGQPGVDFGHGEETAILHVDGGYVLLSLADRWQAPTPFQGTLLGISTGGKPQTPKATATPSAKDPTPQPTVNVGFNATPAPTATPGFNTTAQPTVNVGFNATPFPTVNVGAIATPGIMIPVIPTAIPKVP